MPTLDLGFEMLHSEFRLKRRRCNAFKVVQWGLRNVSDVVISVAAVENQVCGVSRCFKVDFLGQRGDSPRGALRREYCG